MFRTLIGSAATIALSAALMTAPAIAHHRDGHGGGGGGGSDIAMNNTTASWDGPGIDEIDDRACHVETVNVHGTFGRYLCDFAEDFGPVVFSLTDAKELDKRERAVASTGLCDGSDGTPGFENTTMAPNTNYFYEWTGDCTVGCVIRVVNWFFNADGAPDPANTGLIIVEGFGQTTGASNANPFNVTNPIDIDRVLITVNADGKSRTLGVCEYEPASLSFGSTAAP